MRALHIVRMLTLLWHDRPIHPIEIRPHFSCQPLIGRVPPRMA
ncbi:hypothetical protein SXCC_01430 [Gluconacetobacter sp. SXCC-1]|nr:hypothetical protein SXCC_01430 [Gluconacetobacter sp. SXCC-1]